MKTNLKLKQQIYALGDPTRFAIFERLERGPLAVVQIAKGLPVSRPAVSQHLKVLKDAGLVTDQRAGNRRLYSLSPAGLGELRDYFQQFWSLSLSAFKEAAESESDAP
ncbi:MAG TPA: metalloregulator ArsR/SmtB family transcription factor [Gammaproteobacteria bacterium]|nr:metalloregulator ArsR/SmtB family transcription factor [Gammaproteobacteria bacterium]